jgi:hypothetical protein
MASWSKRTFVLNDSNISTSKGTASFDPPAVYIDYEWRWGLIGVASGVDGSNTFPTDGTDARAAGRPGSGGNGGALTTNQAALAASLTNRGASSGTNGRTYQGGSAGFPQHAGKYKVKLWHNVLGTNDASKEVHKTDSHTSRAGATKTAPGPIGGTGQTPVPKVLAIANAWLHPLGLQCVLAYARDLLLADARDAVFALLSAYEKALAVPMPDNGAWTSEVASWTGAQSEVASMLQRLDAHLDYFGNAAGYTPLLSLAGTVKLYAEETRRALRMQLLVEWITTKERDTKAMAAALNTTIDNLNEESKAAALRITTAEAAIAKSMRDLDTLEQELGSLSNRLDVLRNELLTKARNDENMKAQIRFAIRIGAALCQVIPVGQPVLGTLGSLAGAASEFVGDDGSKAPDTVSKIGDIIGKARKAAKAAEDAKKKAEEKSKEKPEDVRDAKEEASAWAKVGDGLGPALSEVSAGLKTLQVPDSAVHAQLERLQSEDPEWNRLTRTIEEVNHRKAGVFSDLTGALQALGEAYGRVSANAAALVRLQQTRSAAAGRLDPAATGVVKDMGQRSRLTLLKYLYLMARAYETTVLKPIDVDWQLTAVTTKIKELIADAQFNVASLNQYVDALTPIFESNLDTVRRKLLDEFSFREQTTPLRLVLTQAQLPEAITTLNNVGELVINPLRFGLILPDQQTARLNNVTLKDVTFDPDGPQLPDAANMVIALQPARRGTLRRDAGLYAVYSDNAIGWSWSYFGPQDIRPSKPSQAAEDVLNLILGKGAENIKQKIALPPAWSDLRLSVLISPFLPANQRPRITALHFELAIDQDRAPENQSVLTVQSLGDVPGVVVDCSADLGDRMAGLNQMLRVYPKRARVKLSVPGTLGGATFAGWDLLGRTIEQTGVQDQTVEVLLDDHVLARCHWSVEPEQVTHVSIAHVMPKIEVEQIITSHKNVAVRRLMKRALEEAPPMPNRLLRAQPHAQAPVVGIVPAGVTPTVLETGPHAWRLALQDGIAGWMQD